MAEPRVAERAGRVGGRRGKEMDVKENGVCCSPLARAQRKTYRAFGSSGLQRRGEPTAVEANRAKRRARCPPNEAR